MDERRNKGFIISEKHKMEGRRGTLDSYSVERGNKKKGQGFFQEEQN